MGWVGNGQRGRHRVVSGYGSGVRVAAEIFPFWFARAELERRLEEDVAPRRGNKAGARGQSACTVPGLEPADMDILSSHPGGYPGFSVRFRSAFGAIGRFQHGCSLRLTSWVAAFSFCSHFFFQRAPSFSFSCCLIALILDHPSSASGHPGQDT